MNSTYLITGATGFIGSHLAEACVSRGIHARTVARTTSDTALLERLGVEIVRGDLTDPATVARAADGVDAIIHSAAKVGDWGPISDYRPMNVDATRMLLEACRGRPVKRFVHISSLGIYAYGNHYGTDESVSPPERHIDGYTQTKVESEQLILEASRRDGIPTVVLRPGFVYGEREPKVFPRVIEAIQKGEFAYVGSGQQVLNTIYVGNFVHAVFLAIEKPAAVGQVYNLTDGEPVSRRRFIGPIVKALGLKEPGTSIYPVWFAPTVAAVVEDFGRLIGLPKPPWVTRVKLKFSALNLDFSIDKARRELGYKPPFGFDQAMERTLNWYRQHNHSCCGAVS
jgi:nucleoside-diphosphate-sugar epimerase